MNSPELTLTKNTTKNKYMTKIENTPPPFPLELFKSRHFCLFKDETLLITNQDAYYKTLCLRHPEEDNQD